MKKISLKQQSKLADKAILEANRDFYDKLVEHYYGEQSQTVQTEQKKRSKGRLIGFAGLGAVAIVALVIGLILLLPLLTNPPEKNYLVANERSNVSELSAVNADVYGFELTIDSSYSSVVTQIYDSLSNDVLFYDIKLDDGVFRSASIYIYPNKDYKSQKQDTTPKTEIINGLTVNYDSFCEEKDGLYEIRSVARIEISGIVLFIEYTQMSLDQNTDFFQFIADTVKLK